MKINCAHDELVEIHKVTPNPKNPNEHSKDQIERLAKIIDYQGQRSPIVVSNRTGFITKGHGRLEAMKLLKWEKVAIDYQDYESEAQEYADIVADNAIAEWSVLDLSSINTEMLDLGPDFDIDLLGIKDFVLEPIEKFEAQSDEDDVPEVVHPITRKGDIWVLGNHRLMCGDSTMIDDVEKLMNGEKATLVFTDPPYNQETSGGCKGEIGKSLKRQASEIESMCDFDPEIFLSIVPTVFEKNKMNALIFCNKDLVVDYLKWARDCGYAYNILFWKKPNAIPLGGSYRPDVEYLLVFRKSGIFNSGIKDVSYSKCLEHDREKNKVHPTMKPVEMIENQIQISSNKNDVILDFFGGSGSTMIAAEKQQRASRLMELDEKYVDVIIKRWETYTGKKATLELTNQTYEELKAERDGETA